MDTADRAKTILLVEDEALIAMAEALTLQKYGYRAITVYSGRQAIDAFETSPEIELVLMDIDLGKGEMDGTQAAEIILRRHDLPLIFLSGHTERAVVEKTEGITSYGYIVKNTGETVLIASIKMAFRLFEARQLERQKDAALRQSEEKFAAAFQHAPALMTISDIADGRLLSLNDAFVRLTGFSRQEALGSTSLELGLFPPADRARMLAVLQAQGRVEGMEITLYARDGHPLPVLFNGEVIQVDGQPRMLSIVQDISGRKRTEQALRESQSLYQSLVDMLPQNLYRIDRGGHITFANRAMQAYLRLPLEQLLGRSAYSLGPPEQAQQHRQNDEEIMRTGKPLTETRLYGLLPDGQARVIESVKTPLYDADGGIAGLQGVFWDVTEQERAKQALCQSEARYRALVEALPVAVILNDLHGRIQVCNAEAARLHGFNGPHDLVGQFVADLFAPQELPRIREALAVAIRQGASGSAEYRLRRADGSEFVGELSLAIVAQPGQAPDAVVGVMFDTSQRKQMEEAVKKTLQEKRDLLRELQHRAKNTLSAITSMIDLMGGAGQNDETRTILAELDARVRAFATLYDLLSISDASATTSLDVYAARVVASLPLPDRVRLLQAYDPILVPIRVATPVGLILTELLTNVIKHAFPGERHGTVSVSLRQAAGHATLQVQDDGAGLPAGFDLSRTGTLGLTLVQTLAQQIRGGFRLDCAAGSAAGTRCVVQFPLEEDDPPGRVG